MKKGFYTFSINLFLAFTIPVFEPMEILIANSPDFQFTFSDFWWMISVFALIYLLISTVVLAPPPDKLCRVVASLIFAFTLCCCIQTMFLNSKMQVLVGQEIEWGIATIVSNLFIWIFLLALVFVLQYLLKEKNQSVQQFFSLSLVAVQLVALISLLLTTDVLSEQKNGYVSTKNMLELSQANNVIVFILDVFEGIFMDVLLNENEMFLSPLEGFTYYPNATSIHSRTYSSVPYILTGNICYFDKEPPDFVDEAYAESNFISTLYENEIDIGLYTFPIYIGNTAKEQMCNYVSENLKLNFEQSIRVCGKMTLYRDMPYFAKNRFEYDVSDINNRVIKELTLGQSDAGSVAAPYQNFNDEWFEQTLTESDFDENSWMLSFLSPCIRTC